MANPLLRKLIKDYMDSGIPTRQAHYDATETYKEIRAEIRAGGDAGEVLEDYGLGEEFLSDVS